MKRLSHRGKDKSKPFDGTINPKGVEMINALLELLNKQTSLEGIYRIPGDMGEVRRTKEALNQGKKVSYESMNPHTQASLLKSYLKELNDPVFTAKLYPGWIAAAQHKDRKILLTRLLNMLPAQNLQIISTLMIHLRHISEHHASNLMTAENLAIVFGPILLRPSSVSVETLFADVPYVNKCIGMLITECSFFFKNKLVLLHRQTKQTSLFEEMRKAGAELIIEERKRREKEEKRLKDEQRKSERKKGKFNTTSGSAPKQRQTIKAFIDSEFDPSLDDHHHSPNHQRAATTSAPTLSASPAPDPSSPTGSTTTTTTTTTTAAAGRGREASPGRPGGFVLPRVACTSLSAPVTPTPMTPTPVVLSPLAPPPALPPLPVNLPPPPVVNAGTLRRTVSAYNPVPAPGESGGGRLRGPATMLVSGSNAHPQHHSAYSPELHTQPGAPLISPRARPARPLGVSMTPPPTFGGAPKVSPDVPPRRGAMTPKGRLFPAEDNDSENDHPQPHHPTLEYDERGIPVPPPPPPPMELTEEEKRKKIEDENLLHNMRRRYVDRRKQTLDRWFKRKNDWTEEEFNKAMEERAARIENGEYSPQDLQNWFAEMGATGDDEDPLSMSQQWTSSASASLSFRHQMGGGLQDRPSVEELRSLSGTDGEPRSPGSAASSSSSTAASSAVSTASSSSSSSSSVSSAHSDGGLCVS